MAPRMFENRWFIRRDPGVTELRYDAKRQRWVGRVKAGSAPHVPAALCGPMGRTMP